MVRYQKSLDMFSKFCLRNAFVLLFKLKTTINWLAFQILKKIFKSLERTIISKCKFIRWFRTVESERSLLLMIP